MALRRSTEDYLKTIFILHKKSGAVRAVDIAAELSLSKPTVSVALKSLKNEGYITLNSVHQVRLTPKGEEIGISVFERHQLFASLLQELGVESGTASFDACRIEHVLSSESYQALKNMAVEYLQMKSRLNETLEISVKAE